MLQLKNITKDYVTSSETVHALRGIDISFRDHEFVSVLGPSGCGKTTLLNIIGGLDHYTSGDLVINSKSTRLYRDRDWDVYRNHRVGFIFQSYNLIPHQTVLGNVELALTIAGIDKKERIERAKRALDRVGLEDQYYKKPNQLSGGQCQRVAIARALVNDPEILLADEPTGALDTVTSVQIMNLIREIAGERLVIMVTHNPDLAREYSTRIVSLRDGEVVEDTMPVTDEEILEYERSEVVECEAEPKKKTKESAKMSPLTALKLSARNLISKKARTTMVGIAGSIGIIGIAMVLAFSAGIKGFVDYMQDDMLSGNPITIKESTYDLNALTGMMNDDRREEIIKNPNRVYISSLIEYITKMDSQMQSLAIENNLTKEYIDYVKAMPNEYYDAIIYDYGFNLNHNLYTDFKLNSESEARKYSISMITAMYTSILKDTSFSSYAQYISALAPSFSQLPSDGDYDYIYSQYDLVGEGSRMPTEAGEIMLVLDSNEELSDLLLARYGFFTQEEFLEIIDKASNTNYEPEKYRESFAYDELIGKTMIWYPNDTVFTENTGADGMAAQAYKYNHEAKDFSTDGAIELRVVGILMPKTSVSFGSMKSGIYYTADLAEYVLAANAESKIFDYINGISETINSAMAIASYYINYTYEYVPYGDDVTPKKASANIGPATSMTDMMSSMMGSSQTAFDHAETKANFIRTLGGNSLPNAVTIYPVSFADKDSVTEYLEDWNRTEGNEDVTFDDTLELVINLINNMIDIISYALIAFTSISLVVSTVMIGIITYVSVVERIKEIGVIRSLGGRKRDVSNLFVAETLIIGLLAGTIGVVFTYVVSIVVNLILKPLIGYASIASLPAGQAVLLVALSVVLTLISGVMPARSAARKDPVVALRTE